MTLFAAGVAAQKFLTSLKEQQEILSWIADMVIQTYAMESVALRALRLHGTLDAEQFEDRRAATRFALETGMPIVETAAQQVLSASADGEELRSMLSMQRKLTRRQPFSMRDAGRRVARAVIRAEGYPFV
jgi:DNA-binding IclR family transcriptional regulator